MKCEKCGKWHDRSYGSGRFCSAFCARSYSTIKMDRTIYKYTKCIECGKEIIVNKQASSKKCRCDECKEIMKKTKICKICGSKNINGCSNEFCKKHDWKQFNALIKYFGFDKTKFGTHEVEIEFYRVRNIIYDLYWNQHKSSKEISDMFNYPDSSNLVEKIMRRTLGIKIKNIGYALSENLSEGRTNLPNNISNNRGYKSQWYTTWDGRKVFLRSSYELDYAKYLIR